MMDKEFAASLETRIEALERENSWLKRIGGAAILGLGLVVAIGTHGFRAPRHLTAESLVLNDHEGQPRARFEVRRDGAPTLSLFDREGHDQVVLRAGIDGSSALEYYEGRAPRASLSSVASAGSSLNLYSRTNRSQAKMFATPIGVSGIVFNRDLRTVGMTMNEVGKAEVAFGDRYGQARGAIGLDEDGELAIISDEDRTGEGSKPYDPTSEISTRPDLPKSGRAITPVNVLGSERRRFNSP